MFRLVFPLLLFLLSCGQKKDKTKTTDTTGDSISKVDPVKPADESKTSAPVTGNPTTAEENAVNAALIERFGDQWRVLNDKSSGWMKEAFEYFIVPKRKEFPNYPYITLGDFNNDGKQDTAALIRNDARTEYQLIIFTGEKDPIIWKEDIIEDAAISTLAKPVTIKGMEPGNIEKAKTVRTKGDAIEVEYFEKASFVLYWEKGKFKRVQTSD